MKTLIEWVRKLNGQPMNQWEEVIQEIRQEAFERCELEAYRADSETSENTGLEVPTGWGRHVAERIAEVFKEEGVK